MTERSPTRFRPRFDVLEDRCLLSGYRLTVSSPFQQHATAGVRAEFPKIAWFQGKDAAGRSITSPAGFKATIDWNGDGRPDTTTTDMVADPASPYVFDVRASYTYPPSPNRTVYFVQVTLTDPAGGTWRPNPTMMGVDATPGLTSPQPRPEPQPISAYKSRHELGLFKAGKLTARRAMKLLQDNPQRFFPFPFHGPKRLLEGWGYVLSPVAGGLVPIHGILQARDVGPTSFTLEVKTHGYIVSPGSTITFRTYEAILGGKRRVFLEQEGKLNGDGALVQWADATFGPFAWKEQARRLAAALRK